MYKSYPPPQQQQQQQQPGSLVDLYKKLLYSGLHFIQKFATPTLHENTATFTMDDEDIYSSAPAICS